MKITINQLRRIIKEEVGRIMEMDDSYGMKELDKKTFNSIVEKIRELKDQFDKFYSPFIEDAAKMIESIRDGYEQDEYEEDEYERDY